MSSPCHVVGPGNKVGGSVAASAVSLFVWSGFSQQDCPFTILAVLSVFAT